MERLQLRPQAYVLAVRELAGTSDYFINVLGFELNWEDPGNWRAVQRGEVRIMLGHCPDAIAVADLGDHSYFGFFSTNDVDALHSEFVERGARILSKPKSKPWGWREMAIATPEGHRMIFATSLDT